MKFGLILASAFSICLAMAANSPAQLSIQFGIGSSGYGRSYHGHSHYDGRYGGYPGYGSHYGPYESSSRYGIYLRVPIRGDFDDDDRYDRSTYYRPSQPSYRRVDREEVPVVKAKPVANVAHLEIRLPDENGEVWLQGQKFTDRGSVRQFVSPELEPKSVYVYRVSAAWHEGEKLVTQQRAIDIQAGERIIVDFRQPDPAAKAFSPAQLSADATLPPIQDREPPPPATPPASK